MVYIVKGFTRGVNANIKKGALYKFARRGLYYEFGYKRLNYDYDHMREAKVVVAMPVEEENGG